MRLSKIVNEEFDTLPLELRYLKCRIISFKRTSQYHTVPKHSKKDLKRCLLLIHLSQYISGYLITVTAVKLNRNFVLG